MNILEYGAIPDGVTDNKPILQEMIAKGFDLEIPKQIDPNRKFYVGSPLYISNKTRTTISGRGTLLFNKTRGIIINGNVSKDCLVEGVTIEGASEGVYIHGAHRTVVRDCRVLDFTEYGINIDGFSNNHDVKVKSSLISTSIENNLAIGVRLGSVDSFCDDNTIIGASIGVVCDAPACDITNNHIFRGVQGGHLSKAVVLRTGANHLILVTGNYLDNAYNVFLEVASDQDNTILVAFNKFLRKDNPNAPWITGKITPAMGNIYRDNS